MSHLDDILKNRLEQKGNTFRRLKPILQYRPRYLTIKNNGVIKHVLNFASNDYLGLSNLITDIEIESQPSSRLLGGNLLSLEQIENELAEFMSFESATILQSGYVANQGLLACLAMKGDLILADYSVHASLIDGMRLSHAEWKRFKHCDLSDLEGKIKKYKDQYEHIWVVAESLFSMDGDTFPMEGLIALKNQYNFSIVLDEAHGFGIYGEQGRGVAHQFKLSSKVDIMTFNFSKALALQGGVILGSQHLKPYLVNRCRPLIYSTATPWSHLATVPLKLAEVKIADDKRKHLEVLSRYAQQRLGLKLPMWSPIVPIELSDHEKTKQISQKLLEHNIFCPAILPPTVPENKARLRLSINSSHEKEDLDQLFEVLHHFRK